MIGLDSIGSGVIILFTELLDTKAMNRQPTVGEFSFINNILKKSSGKSKNIIMGIGDDAAIIHCDTGRLVSYTTTLIEGQDFQYSQDPKLTANLTSQRCLNHLSACGVLPRWLLLSLSVERLNSDWLTTFCQQLLAQMKIHGLQLIGGDTTKGDNIITINTLGQLDEQQKPIGPTPRLNDYIYVTGTLGDTGLALLCLYGPLGIAVSQRDFVLNKLQRPLPHLGHGYALRPWISGCLPLPLGLVKQLENLLSGHSLGARIFTDKLPLSNVVREHLNQLGGVSHALHSPEASEVCFFVPADKQLQFEAMCASLPGNCTWIGQIEPQAGIRCIGEFGEEIGD